MFAVLSAAMEQAGLFSLLSRLLFFLPLSTETLHGLCSGILEMTNGAHLLSLSPDGLRLRLTLVAFLVSFGGLSILGQTFGVLAAMPISKKTTSKGSLSMPFSAAFLSFCSIRLFIHTHKKKFLCFFRSQKPLLHSLFSGFCQACFSLWCFAMQFPAEDKGNHLPIRSS